MNESVFFFYVPFVCILTFTFRRYDITTLKKLQSSDSEDVRGVIASAKQLQGIIQSEFVDKDIPLSRVVIGGYLRLL